MANIFLYTTIAIVVSSSVNCERRAFVSNTNNFLKVVPHHWKYDKEELNRNLVKNARQPWGEMRMGPRPPPLHPNPLAQWPLGVHRNQLSDEGQTKKRIQQLQNKLTPQNNIIPIKTLNHPHPKPEIEVKLQEYKRHKREATQLENYVRQKRDMVIQPEVVMQPHIQPALLQKVEPKDPEKDTEKRDKRQILLMIKQQPLNFGKKPRTTPNPFIRETNIADYDIVKTDIDKPELDVIDTVDTDSYQLSPIQKVLSEFTKMLLNMKNWFYTPKEDPILQVRNSARIKRSPKMSKLHKRQKLEKKKRKKKKQQKLTPRQIKHYRRIREHKEKRRRILHKKLKEKRRLRHKKMGTGPYNKSIIDYYGVYFDSSSSQLNDSLYDSIYDTNAIDSEQIYQEHLKNYPDYSGENEDSEDDSGDEDYTLEESSEEEESNKTVNYEDPPSTPLNDSLFNSIYDTEAIDSDKIYEEQMKNYPESEEEEESEEENSENMKESSDISKGDDDKGMGKNRKASTEIKNENKKNNKLKNIRDVHNRQQIKSTKVKNVLKTSMTGKLFLNSKDKRQKSNLVQVVDQVNKQKLASKLSFVKQTENKMAKTKRKIDYPHFNNNAPPKSKVVEQNGQSKIKYNPTSHLVDVILDNRAVNDNSYTKLNYQNNINYLTRLKQAPHLLSTHYEDDIIPIVMRDFTPFHRRIPI